MPDNYTIRKIRTKYASGLYSNTELVIEFAATIGALGIISILNYSISPEICEDKRLIITEMPEAQEVLTTYFKGLRVAYAEIEDSNMDNDWRDQEYAMVEKRLTKERDEALKKFSWFTKEMLNKMYHD